VFWNSEPKKDSQVVINREDEVAFQNRERNQISYDLKDHPFDIIGMFLS
jgi:hypothetical protein